MSSTFQKWLLEQVSIYLLWKMHVFWWGSSAILWGDSWKIQCSWSNLWLDLTSNHDISFLGQRTIHSFLWWYRFNKHNIKDILLGEAMKDRDSKLVMTLSNIIKVQKRQKDPQAGLAWDYHPTSGRHQSPCHQKLTAHHELSERRQDLKVSFFLTKESFFRTFCLFLNTWLHCQIYILT